MRTRLVATFSLISLFTLMFALVLQSSMGQRERQRYMYRLVRDAAEDIAILRAAAEDGAIDSGVYLEWLGRAIRDNGLSVWLVDARGAIWAPDVRLRHQGAADNWKPFRMDIGSPFSAEDIERYVAPVLRGEVLTVTGDFGGRLPGHAVTAIVPIQRAGGLIVSVLFVYRSIDAMEHDEILIIWRQAAQVTLEALAVSFLLIFWQGKTVARPYENLVAAHASVADRLDEATKLHHAFERLEEQSRDLEELRRGFVSNVSHELRSPLTNIIGYLQGLLDGAVCEKERLHYTAVALEEARRMSALVDVLLDLSRLGSGRFELTIETFDICEVLRRSLVVRANRMEARGLRVSVEFTFEEVYVRADPRWIRQVIDNLIDNAMKYADHAIALRVQLSQDCVYASVADDGSGIAPQDLPHVFEWFYKADKSHAGEGTGLGLAIVRSIIDRHGQAVHISSRPANGTIVTFTLEHAIEK